MSEKPIRFSAHAHQQLARRGAEQQEVIQAIRSSEWKPAGKGRFECAMNFPFGQKWNGKMYNTKQVRPIFAEEADSIVVVTVYTYYF